MESQRKCEGVQVSRSEQDHMRASRVRRAAAKILSSGWSPSAGRMRLAECSSGTEHPFVPTPSVCIDSLISAEGHLEAAHNPVGGTFLSFSHTVLLLLLTLPILACVVAAVSVQSTYGRPRLVLALCLPPQRHGCCPLVLVAVLKTHIQMHNTLCYRCQLSRPACLRHWQR